MQQWQYNSAVWFTPILHVFSGNKTRPAIRIYLGFLTIVSIPFVLIPFFFFSALVFFMAFYGLDDVSNFSLKKRFEKLENRRGMKNAGENGTRFA